MAGTREGAPEILKMWSTKARGPVAMPQLPHRLIRHWMCRRTMGEFFAIRKIFALLLRATKKQRLPLSSYVFITEAPSFENRWKYRHVNELASIAFPSLRNVRAKIGRHTKITNTSSRPRHISEIGTKALNAFDEKRDVIEPMIVYRIQLLPMLPFPG